MFCPLKNLNSQYIAPLLARFFTIVVLWGRDQFFLFLGLFPVWSMIHLLFLPPSYASLISVKFLIGIKEKEETWHNKKEMVEAL